MERGFWTNFGVERVRRKDGESGLECWERIEGVWWLALLSLLMDRLLI